MTASGNTPGSEMTGTRQTMLTWARVLENFDEIPDGFKDACSATLAARTPFPYVVLAPMIKAPNYRASDRVLCEVEGVLHIWETFHGKVQQYSYPLENICMLEIGSILLNSWLTVHGQNSAGVFASTVVPYNTATLRHLLPFTQKLRPVSLDLAEPAWQAQLDRFDTLAPESFKFMNFARESMVRGAKVLEMILQPAILQHQFTVLWHSFDRIISLSHLAILTDRELILIRDDERSVESRGKRYGGVWRYIPLRHVRGLTLGPATDERLTLSITLDGGPALELIFAASNQTALERFRDQVEQQRVRVY